MTLTRQTAKLVLTSAPGRGYADEHFDWASSGVVSNAAKRDFGLSAIEYDVVEDKVDLFRLSLSVERDRWSERDSRAIVAAFEAVLTTSKSQIEACSFRLNHAEAGQLTMVAVVRGEKPESDVTLWTWPFVIIVHNWNRYFYFARAPIAFDLLFLQQLDLLAGALRLLIGKFGAHDTYNKSAKSDQIARLYREVVRWSREIGQVAKVGSTERKDGPDDGQAETVLG